MIIRSMLYVPGNNLKLINKAFNLFMDAVILDIEDSVPISEKVIARKNVIQSINSFKETGKIVFVRINSIKTGLTKDDINEVICRDLDGIMLSKAESKEEIEQLNELIAIQENKIGLEVGRIKVVPLIESALGVINSYSIAKSNSRIYGIAFGAGDYMSDLGLDVALISKNQDELLYARSKIINSCKAVGLESIDTPYLQSIKDIECFKREVSISKKLGFNGKQCIHPSQIEIINEIFAPSKERVGYSMRLVKAFEEAENIGIASISFEGKMIDIMSYKQAKKVIQKDIEIQKKNNEAPRRRETVSQLPYVVLSKKTTS